MKQNLPLISGIGVMLILFHMVAAVLLVSPHFRAALGAQVGTGTSTLSCSDIEGGYKCTCTKANTEGTDQARTLEASDGAKASVTITDNRNLLQLECRSDLKFSPEDPAGVKVCLANKQLSDCKDENMCVPISNFVAGSGDGIAWKPVPETKRMNHEETRSQKSERKQLEIPTKDLPYIDGTFLVGCVDSTKTKTACELTVNVEARASMHDNRIVTCAYGRNSNKGHMAVTVNQSQNSFTLVCGSNGDILPINYKTDFCATKAGEDATPDCSGRYESILPAYAQDWWKENAPGSFTLEIPPDNFPTVPANVTLSCQHKTKSPSEKRNTESEQLDEPTVCTVDVTIASEANSFASLSAGFLAFAVANVVVIVPFVQCA